jgi:hypothetical protein
MLKRMTTDHTSVRTASVTSSGGHRPPSKVNFGEIDGVWRRERLGVLAFSCRAAKLSTGEGFH